MHQQQLHTLTDALVRVLQLAQEVDPKTGYLKPVDPYELNEICTIALHESAPAVALAAHKDTCRKLVYGPVVGFSRPKHKWRFRPRKWLPPVLVRLAITGAQAFHHLH